jgi:hypothetical protein
MADKKRLLRSARNDNLNIWRLYCHCEESRHRDDVAILILNRTKSINIGS